MPPEPARFASESAPAGRAERAWLGWLAGSALFPACVAAGQLDLYDDGGRDAAVVRTVGLGYTGGLRALDAWLAAPFAELPLGTRTLRAELPGVLLLALVAALLFVVIRRMLVRVAGASVWSSLVAAIGTAMVSCSYPFQREAVSPGSSLAGVVLVLLALAVPTRAAPVMVALFSLAVSYDPAIGACVAVALGASVLRARATSGDAPGPPRVATMASVMIAALVGLAPFALLAVHSRVTLFSTGEKLFAWPHAHDTGLRHAALLLDAEVGKVTLLLAGCGLVWGAIMPRGRADALTVAAVATPATAAFVAGRGGVGDVWSPGALVVLLATGAFAAVAMHEAVIRTARARLPLASASAAMVVLLETAFPAIVLDESLTRADRPPLALATWEDTAVGGLPSGALIVVSSPRLYTRLVATEAAGESPGDLVVLPTFDPGGEAAGAALAHDSALVPLVRDITLTGVPQELSLSTLAAARPVVLATDPRWERTLTRHLVPTGLLAVFQPEPRGGADRKHALEATSAARTRLVKALTSPADPALAALTTALLFDRALAAVQTGEREVAQHALEDVAAFAPADARVRRLATREAATPHGPVEVKDLLREGLAAGE